MKDGIERERFTHKSSERNDNDKTESNVCLVRVHTAYRLHYKYVCMCIFSSQPCIPFVMEWFTGPLKAIASWHSFSVWAHESHRLPSKPMMAANCWCRCDLALPVLLFFPIIDIVRPNISNCCSDLLLAWWDVWNRFHSYRMHCANNGPLDWHLNARNANNIRAERIDRAVMQVIRVPFWWEVCVGFRR